MTHHSPDAVAPAPLNDDTGLYPSILFHFTNREGLLGILRNNFRVTYSRERLVGKAGKVEEFGAPMVSFCDLRLSQLRKHMGAYGAYGIGMSKEWANSNGLNTVYYINAHAELADGIFVSIRKLFDHVQTIQDPDQRMSMEKVYMDLLNTYRYIKNYEGELWRKGVLVDRNYRFANEREWRYVPPLEGELFPFVSKEVMDSPGQKAGLSRHFTKPLYFEPKDIRYIIVERETERDEIIDRVLEAKESKYGHHEARRLASRILTAEQIYNDF